MKTYVVDDEAEIEISTSNTHINPEKSLIKDNAGNNWIDKLLSVTRWDTGVGLQA